MDDSSTDVKKPTVPTDYVIHFKGDFDADAAENLGKTIGIFLSEISKHIDLASLDGITIATDYHQALIDLDRGYETSHVLTATNDTAIGVAMTPSVMRDGKIKSHIVFNFGYIAQIALPEHEFHPYAVHTLAHEAAHVEVTAAFDSCFPEVLLRPKMMSLGDRLLSEITRACWEEYAVCRIAAGIGADPTDNQIEVFLGKLGQAIETGNAAIKKFRLHGDNDSLIVEMTGIYGNLMKFAGYVIGTLDGFGKSVDECEELSATLQGSWFEFYFYELQREIRNIWSNYGGWKDEAQFHPIGEIAKSLISDAGVQITLHPDFQTSLHVPLLRETVTMDFAMASALLPRQTFQKYPVRAT